MTYIVVAVVCSVAGFVLGIAVNNRIVDAALATTGMRVSNRTALFLMEVRGKDAYACAISAAERERWRCDPLAEAFWLDTAEAVRRLEGRPSDEA
jgi:hypothetical protein